MTDTPTPSGAASDVPGELEAALRAALAPAYQLLGPVGAGGMGAVFLARQPALKRTVAVKVLAPPLGVDGASRARFEREAQAVASLSHPNIVAVHAVGELKDGTPYFVMQYVAGPSLARRIAEEGPQSVAETRRILGEVASALVAAHAKGIVHRDIKPGNILMDDETGHVLVSDFGIAAVPSYGNQDGIEAVAGAPRGAGGEVDLRLTATGEVIGTPQYMSPEQLRAEPASEKTDVYALGLLAYELLTGAGPFPVTTPQELIAACLRDAPPRLLTLRDDVDAELDALIARCLEKDPVKRPGAKEVAQRLGSGRDVLLEWPPPGLEDLAGGLALATRWYGVGTILLVAAALPLLLAGPAVDAAGPSIGATLLLIASLLGLGVLIAAARITIRLGTAATQAVRGGFAWLTVLEALADPRGGTGKLITGTGEFAGIEADIRSRLRTFRVARAVILPFGCVLSVATLLIIVVLGSSGVGIPQIAWVAPLPAVVAWLSSQHLLGLERQFASPRPKRMGYRIRRDLHQLSRAWYVGFESVRHGQRLGRGARDRAAAGRLTALATIALTVGAGVLLVPLVAVGTVAPSLWLGLEHSVAATQRKTSLAEAARPFGIVQDETITPLQAGLAFGALSRDERGVFPPVTHPRLGRMPWESQMPPDLFPTARIQGFSGPSNLTILQVVQHGMSPAEMAYLDNIAHAEAWPFVWTVARARAVDLLAGRFTIPFPDSASAYQLPPLKPAATVEIAQAAVSRAAWFLARGQRDSAENTLRSVISFGLALKDNGHTSYDAVLSAVVIGVGHSALQQFYSLTRNPLGERLHARWDSAAAAADVFTQASEDSILLGPSVGTRVLRSRAFAIAGDPRYSRGARMEMLATLGLSPCTNLRELVFGPDKDVREAFADARRVLARFASDSALLDVLYTGPERGRFLSLAGAPPRPVERMLMATADVVGVILANRRIPGCLRIAVALRERSGS